MLTNKRSVLIWLATASVLTTLAFTSYAAAQTQSGLTVSPGVIKTAVSKDDPVQQTVVTIRNNYQVPVRLSAELKGIDETGTRLLPGGDLDAAVANTLSVSETDFTIPALSDKRITVQSTYSDKLSPGGHYATLVIAQQSAANGTLSLRSGVSVTIFMTNREGVLESFQLQEFTAPSNIFKLPHEAKITLRNNGNVHSVPRGVVRVEQGNGVVIAQDILNSSSAPVLPDKSFTGTVSLQPLRSSLWPQKIRTILQFRGESSSQVREAIKTSWFIPPGFIALVVILALGILTIWKFRRSIHISRIVSLRRYFKRRPTSLALGTPHHIHDVVRVDKNRGQK